MMRACIILLQVLIGAPCSNKVDMYSFGVIMWELITGEQPRRGMLRDIRYSLIWPTADLPDGAADILTSPDQDAVLVAKTDWGPMPLFGDKHSPLIYHFRE